MALTPPQPNPPRPRQFPAICRIDTGSDPVATQRALTPMTRHFTGVGFLAYGSNWSGADRQQIDASTDTPCASKQARRHMARTLRHKETVGGVGGSGCGGVSAMDGATELTWTYLQRPPHPDPPAHRAGSQLLLLLRPLLQLLPLRVPGGSPATAPPTNTNARASPGVRAPFMLATRVSWPVRLARVRCRTCAASPPGWCGAGRAAGRRGRLRPGCVPVLR